MASGSTAMFRRLRKSGRWSAAKILEHVVLDRVNGGRLADTDRIAFRRRACGAAQDLKMLHRDERLACADEGGLVPGVRAGNAVVPGLEDR